MDTPDKNQLGTPASKFEDSPVFNYINNLSPITSADSHRTSAYQSLGFASISSAFTSPLIRSTEKSKFLRRCYFLEASKSIFSSEDGACTAFSNASQLSDCSANLVEKFRAEASNDLVGMDAADVDQPQLECHLPQRLQCDSAHANGTGTPDCTIGSGLEAELVETPEILAKFIQGLEKRPNSDEDESEVQDACHFGNVKEKYPVSLWENLMTEAAGLLIADVSAIPDASEGSDQKLLENDAISASSLLDRNDSSLATDDDKQNDDASQKTEVICRHASSDLNSPDAPASGCSEPEQQNEISQGICVASEPMNCMSVDKTADQQNEDSNRLDNKVENPIPKHHGIRRRCLVFDVGSGQCKDPEGDLENCSRITLKSDDLCTGKRQTSGQKYSPCMVPGIGLHLNTLAVGTRNCRMVKQEVLASGKRLICVPSCVGAFSSLSIEPKPVSEESNLNSMEQDNNGPGCNVDVDNHLQRTLDVTEDASKLSPKKKRSKLESPGETESCKRCNCKRSRCLKLYCDCFSAGIYCVESCSCQDCFNKPVHEDIVLATRKQIESRNPLAFAPKVIQTTALTSIMGDYNKTPISARHKRGCNCRKSSCNKKYCECYQGKVGCSSNCRCQGCKNTYGVKEGIGTSAVIYARDLECEIEASEKDGPNHCLQLNEDDDAHPSCNSALSLCRVPGSEFYFSSAKPPRPSLPSGSTSQSDAVHLYLQSENFEIIDSNETCTNMNATDKLAVRGVKTVSPSRKRISPPQNGFGIGIFHGRKSSRKLVLQSVPSLPVPSCYGDASSFLK